jgi:hypothetical protein
MCGPKNQPQAEQVKEEARCSFPLLACGRLRALARLMHSFAKKQMFLQILNGFQVPTRSPGKKLCTFIGLRARQCLLAVPRPCRLNFIVISLAVFLAAIRSLIALLFIVGLCNGGCTVRARAQHLARPASSFSASVRPVRAAGA